MDQTKTTGTESPDDGNELEASASPAPEGSDDRNAESEGADKTDWKKLAISLQEKAGRVNDLEARLQELEGGSSPPPVAASPEVKEKTEQIEDLLFRAEEFERRGDPIAALSLRTDARVAKLERDSYLKDQLNDMPKEERAAVKAHFNKNWQRLGDMNAARAELLAPRLEKENQALRDKLALLEKGPDPEVLNAPPTHGHERTARETKRKWTEDQFDSRANAIRQEKGELAYLKFLQENAGNIG